MTFISYAQNAEDVILWRALKLINNGFYIDVGANDPQDDSVTKAFYDRGWHGINIEPLKQHHDCLQLHRHRDINLQLAAGNYNGELTLFDIPSVRGWATSDQKVADNYRKQGFDVVPTRVPVRRLDSLCDEFAVSDIHFLKIDVEGSEFEVLQGMDFKKWRPWVLIIEAIRPNNKESQYQQFEPILFESQYHYIYTDGLNRYYVAQERLDLARALALQPNVFDQYQFIGYQRAEEGLQKAVQQIADLNIQILSLEQQVRISQEKYLELESKSQEKYFELESQSHEKYFELESQLRSLNNQLKTSQQELLWVYSSLSWRVTHPLREMNYLVNRIKQKIIMFFQKTHLMKVKKENKLKKSFRKSLPMDEKDNISQLSPRARSVYVELQNLFKEKNN